MTVLGKLTKEVHNIWVEFDYGKQYHTADKNGYRTH